MFFQRAGTDPHQYRLSSTDGCLWLLLFLHICILVFCFPLMPPSVSCPAAAEGMAGRPRCSLSSNNCGHCRSIIRKISFPSASFLRCHKGEHARWTRNVCELLIPSVPVESLFLLCVCAAVFSHTAGYCFKLHTAWFKIYAGCSFGVEDLLQRSQMKVCSNSEEVKT